MKIEIARKARRQYEALPRQLRSRVDKQLSYLLANLTHPSLRAKKYDEKGDIWQGRINRDYRFYFTIEGDTYVILTIIPHPK